jgi:hypothetical protein
MAAVVALCGWVQPVRGGPRLACNQPQYDFGSVSNRDQVQHTFVLANAGDAELIIRDVRTSCGCTTAQLANKNVPPGGSVDLVATFSLAGRSGKQSKSIHVDSNDPANPQFRLDLSADITRDVEVAPPRVTFYDLAAGASAEAKVRVYSGTGRPFHVTAVRNAESNFYAATLETVRDGQEYSLAVKAKTEAMKPGELRNGTIGLSTDHPAFPTLDIAVLVRVPQDFVVAPRELLFEHPQPAGSLPSRYVYVYSPPQHRFEVVKVECPAEGAETAIEKLADTRYRLKIDKFAPGPEANGKALRIHIRKEGGEEKTLEAPLRLWERRAVASPSAVAPPGPPAVGPPPSSPLAPAP